MKLSNDQYLDLIGIQQWHLRANTESCSLTFLTQPENSNWLFILEKAEAEQDSDLFRAILSAIKQTPDTIALAYFEPTQKPLTQNFHAIKYIVTMGDLPITQLGITKHLFPPEVTVIQSENLSTLTEDMASKRKLWQQLKLCQI